MIKHARRIILVALCLAALPSLAHAQRDDSKFDFYARGPYRESVPRPQAVTHFDVGAFHTNYATMERWLDRVAQAAQDRVRVTDIGETNEHRMMHVVVLSAPENLRRIDEIKANIKRLSDPRGLSAAEAKRITDATPVVVWLAYTIHGNESASFEAMMQVVYQLAASDEPATLDILKNTVVLVVPGENPDGHERFVTWYNSIASGDANPLAVEHREPWSVYGRLNHYRFDLNRDNLIATQVENRNLQRAYLNWNPQVSVDHHGQPSQFFFPPAALPVNPNLPQASTARWLAEFGRANSAQFDQRNWDYYVRDVYDLFYPGYWDSWPALNGATGMTYETDGGGTKGYNWRRDDDTIVTLRSGIAKHFIASLTTLETAARNRAARLQDYYEFRRSATEEGAKEQLKRFVIVPGSDPGRAAELVDALVRAGIAVGVAREGFNSQSAHAYFGATTAAAHSFPAGSYVVDLAQPQKRLAKALLEQNTLQDDAFMREQLARFARNQRRGEGTSKEDYGFYDMTAWSLPLAFGVEAYWTEDAAPLGGVVPATSFNLPLPRSSRELRQVYKDWLTGDVSVMLGADEVKNAQAQATSDQADIQSRPRGGGVSGRASVAYLIPYERNGAASLAYRLMREGFKLAVAQRTLSAGGRTWTRGTLVVRVSRNPEALHDRIAQLARETGVEVFAVNSGFAESGDTVIGSEAVVSLKRPRIIVVADESVSQTGYGWMWWTFDRYGVDFTPMTISNLKRANLDEYNVIIMPDGSAGGYSGALGKSGTDALRAWVQRGGTLVCIKGAAVFAALKDVNLTSSRLVGSADDTQVAASTGKPSSDEDDDDEGGRSKAQVSPTPTPQPSPQETAQEQKLAARKGRRQQTQTAVEQQREVQDKTEKLEGAPPDLPPIASPSAHPERVPEAVPGAVFLATVDRSTPLTYGYEDARLPVLIDSGYFFRPSKEGTNAIVFTTERNQPLRVAGFIWPGNTERLLRNTAYVIDEPTGRGHVVLFAEDPNYRGIWRATTRLFFNSFLFTSTF
ncbi:MAG: M14 family zinc carboxypeptidase [Pyrinomonadaceae bacterium]